MKKQTLKKMWVCQNGDVPPYLITISDTEEGSIQKLIGWKGVWTKDTSEDWESWRSYGWNCFKVDITFEPCSPE